MASFYNCSDIVTAIRICNKLERVLLSVLVDVPVMLRKAARFQQFTEGEERGGEGQKRVRKRKQKQKRKEKQTRGRGGGGETWILFIRYVY